MVSIDDRRMLLTSKEAAERLAISERKLWQLTKDCDIPAVRIGRAVRYDPRDLIEWVERCKAPPAVDS
ncbi:MAG: helix-turn-helix domain-containing protein [Planctomycetes bacterium]|nr:helix-turn-helix domain-containing protein [Planctomycetota bacterium]